MQRFGLDANIIQAIKDIVAKYPQVEKAVMFGSRASGQFKDHSDIDLAVLRLNYPILNSVFCGKQLPICPLSSKWISCISIGSPTKC